MLRTENCDGSQGMTTCVAAHKAANADKCGLGGQSKRMKSYWFCTAATASARHVALASDSKPCVLSTALRRSSAVTTETLGYAVVRIRSSTKAEPSKRLAIDVGA